VLEGIPAIVFGVVTIFYLTDRPEQATWLPADEREWIVATLARERDELEGARRYRIREALRHPQVLLLTAAYFLIVASAYGLVFWLPTFVKRLSGSSNATVGLIASLPYAAGLAAILLAGWSSDRTRERRWHTAVPMAVAGAGFLLSAAVGDHAALGVATLCLAAAGTHGYLPGFWSMPGSFLTGSAAAASVGMINSVGNLGGFVGPFLVGYVTTRTGSPTGGVILLAVSALAAAVLVLSLRVADAGRRPT
jgi:ACS family tartrate transporter-like MFS transporter